MKSICKTTVFLLSVLAGITVNSQLGLQSPGFVGQLSKKVSTVSCLSSDTTLPHDTLLEGFQTPGYENSWTEVGTTANINDQYDSSALSTGKPTGACDLALQLTAPTDGTETYFKWNNGSEIDLDTQAVDVVFYLYLDTAPDDGENFYLLLAQTAGSTTDVYITLRNNAGTIEIAGSGASTSAYQSISTGQWLKVKLHMDTTTSGSLSYIQVDDGTKRMFNRMSSRDFQYLSLGTVLGLDVNDSAVMIFDLIAINTP